MRRNESPPYAAVSGLPATGEDDPDSLAPGAGSSMPPTHISRTRMSGGSRLAVSFAALVTRSLGALIAAIFAARRE